MSSDEELFAGQLNDVLVRERLAAAVSNLSVKSLPRLDLGQLYADVECAPPADQLQAAALWEELIGIRVAAKMIDYAVRQVADRLQTEYARSTQLNREKETVLRENIDLKKQLAATVDTSDTTGRQSGAAAVPILDEPSYVPETPPVGVRDLMEECSKKAATGNLYTYHRSPTILQRNKERGIGVSLGTSNPHNPVQIDLSKFINEVANGGESHASYKERAVCTAVPGTRSAIDVNAGKDPNVDFPQPMRGGSGEKSKKESKEVWAENDSDFESPDLDKRHRNVKPKENVNVDFLEDIDSPEQTKDSSVDMVMESEQTWAKKPGTAPKAVSGKIRKAENRWELEVTELTETQSRKRKCQKQTTLDRFFGPKAERRDSDYEGAIELSKKTYKLENVEPKMDNKSDNISSNNKNSPNFKYVHSPVRKKADRKKLRGHDCYDCRDYYLGKLEEGYTEEQVEKLINDCSKHRAKFKPPLTPPNFWDPEIIEGDPDDPRNVTQQPSQPLKSRARRRAEERDRRRAEAQQHPAQLQLKEEEDMNDDALESVESGACESLVGAQDVSAERPTRLTSRATRRKRKALQQIDKMNAATTLQVVGEMPNGMDGAHEAGTGSKEQILASGQNDRAQGSAVDGHKAHGSGGQNEEDSEKLSKDATPDDEGDHENDIYFPTPPRARVISKFRASRRAAVIGALAAAKERAVEPSRNWRQALRLLPTAQCIQFAVSNLTVAQTACVELLVDKLGCAGLASEVGPDVTHLIVSTDEHMRAQRTLKWLQGLASGQRMLSHLWVETALANHWLPPFEKYEATDAELDGARGAHLSWSAREAGQPGLLSGCEVLTVCKGEELAPAAVEDLLIRAGAELVPDEESFSAKPGTRRLVIVDDMFSQPLEVVARRLTLGIATVHVMWLGDSLSTWSFRQVSEYTHRDLTFAAIHAAGVGSTELISNQYVKMTPKTLKRLQAKKGQSKRGKAEGRKTARAKPSEDAEESAEETAEEREEQETALAQLSRWLSAVGLNLQPGEPTRPDGNCFYRAISDQIKILGIPDKPTEHMLLRKSVCDSMRHLPADIKTRTIDAVFHGRNRGLADLAYRQRKRGKFIDDSGIIAMATALYLRRDIAIYSAKLGGEGYNITTLDGGGPERGPALTLYYSREQLHYQSLKSAL